MTRTDKLIIALLFVYAGLLFGIMLNTMVNKDKCKRVENLLKQSGC